MLSVTVATCMTLTAARVVVRDDIPIIREQNGKIAKHKLHV